MRTLTPGVWPAQPIDNQTYHVAITPGKVLKQPIWRVYISGSDPISRKDREKDRLYLERKLA